MNKFFVISFLLFLLACAEEEVYVVPDNILAQEKMVPLIVDLQILESHFQRQFGRVDLFKEALDSSSQSIFLDHGVTKESYERSLDFYTQTPDTLYVIYEAALDTINFRLDRINTIPEKQDTTAVNEDEQKMRDQFTHF